MKLSEFKEAVRKVLRERSINAISKLQQRNIENIASALEFYKKNKHTDKKEPFIKLLKKLGKEKEALAKELDMKVSGMYKNAEYKGESVNEASAINRLNSVQDVREKMASHISLKKARDLRKAGINKKDAWFDKQEKTLLKKSYRDLEKLYLKLGGKRLTVK